MNEAFGLAQKLEQIRWEGLRQKPGFRSVLNTPYLA
jgi:hypothetical protein